MNKDLDKKARRRIKRAIASGLPVHRVRVNADNDIYIYVVKHKKEEERYKAIKDGRLYRVK